MWLTCNKINLEKSPDSSKNRLPQSEIISTIVHTWWCDGEDTEVIKENCASDFEIYEFLWDFEATRKGLKINLIWAIRKCEQNQMKTTEMKLLRRTQGKSRKYNIRNATIREKAHIEPMKSLLTKKRLSWVGHVQRRDDDNVATQIEGSRPWGRPQLRWIDRLKQDMKQQDMLRLGFRQSAGWRKLI